MYKFYDLIEKIKDKGVEEIQPLLDIRHNPTIGDMYEGLLSKILNLTLKPLKNLMVVSGKIKNSNGVYSNQLDCMVVDGVIQKLPFTDDYIVAPENVIAVIEVKKNLFSNEMDDATANLWSVIETDISNKTIKGHLSHTAFEHISGAIDEYNISSIETNPNFLTALKNVLIWEEFYPLRVIFGFSGFSSEYSLRAKFIDMLEKHIGERTFSILGLPNLIVCGEYSLIKTNGMPFTAITDSENSDKFVYYASYKEHSLKIFLELLLTRISDRYDIGIDLLSDPTEERLAPLLYGEFDKDKYGWKAYAIGTKKSELEQRSPVVEPQKIYINEEQWLFMTVLSSMGVLPIDCDILKDKDIYQFLKPFTDHRVVLLSDKDISLGKTCMLSAGNNEYYFVLLPI